MSVSPQHDGTARASEPTPVPSRPGSVRVADQIVAALRRQGIDRVFGIPGGTISPLFDALLDSEIEVIGCQHETMAVYAAAGYARVTGRPGVVMVTSGPGVLNAITGLAAANLDEAPVVVLAGEVATENNGRGALQDGGPGGLDVISMVRPITKFAESLWRPERAAATIDLALREAGTLPCGAAFVRLPVDLTQGSGAMVSTIHTQVSRAAPEPRVVAQIAELLSRARRPALMVGIGGRQPGVSEAVLDLAEWLRCPVFTDIEGKGTFPESHPLSLGIYGVGHRGRAAEYLETPPDVMVTVGARLDDTTTVSYSASLQPTDALVQLDHAPSRLCRSYPSTLAVECEITSTLDSIRRAIPVPDMRTILARDASLRSLRHIEAVPRRLGAAPHDPRAVVRALQEAVGPEAVFTSDIGNHLIFAAQNLVIDRPDGFFVSNGLGGMGSGVGNAIGQQLAHGSSRPVVSICGDGSIGMVGNELATCVKYRIPVLFAVMNDGRYGMVADGESRVYGRGRPWRSDNFDIVAWARSLGAQAVRVTNHELLAHAAQTPRDLPMVLDIPIDPSIRAPNPRDLTLAFPER